MNNDDILIEVQVCELIDSFSGTCERLSQQGKAEFAYGFRQITGLDYSDVYALAAAHYNGASTNDDLDQNELRECVRTLHGFAQKQNMLKIKDRNGMTIKQMGAPTKDETVYTYCRSFKDGNFLEEFDSDKAFESRSTYMHPIIKSFMTPDGGHVKIDKQTAEGISMSLVEEGIYPLFGTVEGAYPWFAKGRLDTYIEKLKSSGKKLKLKK